MTILYKRNAKGTPIQWKINKSSENTIEVCYGIVGKEGHIETITTKRDVSAEIKSMIEAKRKEGYKELQDLYDNAPEFIISDSLYNYLDSYLPINNTHSNGNFIPMLCKTLEDNKPFEKGNYFGQWKINGERCIITASKTNDLFGSIKLNYRSREGVDWTPKLSYLDEVLIPALDGTILDMMVEEDVGLDGELYLPGFSINEINSFIKNTDLPQHYLLQYWCYDICVDNMTAEHRQLLLSNSLSKFIFTFNNKQTHYEFEDHFILLPNEDVSNINEAINIRDKYIDLGFEGLVVREYSAEYQFGGKRNNAMLKFKKKEDGYFTVIDIKEDKRGLPIFTLKNDINDETFDATYNARQKDQRACIENKDNICNKYKALVEYRERSGIKQVPFHAKIVKLSLKNYNDDVNIK